MYKECLNSSIIKRPRGKRVLQNICLNKGFDSDDARIFLSKEFIVHIPERKNRKVENRIKKHPGKRKPRRWVV
jgi:hypothetical protein